MPLITQLKRKEGIMISNAFPELPASLLNSTDVALLRKRLEDYHYMAKLLHKMYHYSEDEIRTLKVQHLFSDN